MNIGCHFLWKFEWIFVLDGIWDSGVRVYPYPRLGVYHHICLPRLGVYHHICLSKSKILSRLNLDARSVPEALVNSFRILTPLRTRLNPPESQIPFKKKSARISIKKRHPIFMFEEIEVADSGNRTPESKFRPNKSENSKTG